MEKDESHPGFTLSLALMDAIPVLLFLATVVVAGTAVHNIVFTIGACFMVFAGVGKVLWKILLGLGKGDVKFLNTLFAPLMIIGFLLIICGVVIAFKKQVLTWGMIKTDILSFPAIVFIGLAVVGLCLMTIIRINHSADELSTQAGVNWMAEWTNTFAQAFLLIGMICAKMHH